MDQEEETLTETLGPQPEDVATSSKYQEELEEFLQSRYASRIDSLATHYPEEKSLIIDYNELDEYNPEVAEMLIKDPYRIITLAKKALEAQKPMMSLERTFKPNVRFKNLPDEYEFSIKDLNSSLINKLVAFEGTVKKITEVKPKLVKAIFECVHCNKIHQIKQNYKDNKLGKPSKCIACNRKSFELLEEDSEFLDTQKVEFQEPIENMRGKEQAKPITAWIQDDLTNILTPGDKVGITGVLRIAESKKKGSIYNKYVDINHLYKKQTEFEDLELTEEDIEEVKKLSNDPLIYERIVGSIAPSIYGYPNIKEAIALQLFGGTQGKEKPDGMHIRPDIHILLIGDPGTAKSQLLQYVEGLSPKGIYVSGKSSSAAGLTATAEKDEFGEEGWTLKAGALVLAAGGMALVDELDKIGKEDRSSLHQAMESQRISVAKAGIVTTFKANAAILAAANPKYGRFDKYELPAEQFNIPPTLMSRFDLMFPVKDEPNREKDRALAKHILITHRVAGTRAIGRKLEAEKEEEEKRTLPDIDPDLLRKYISYSRRHIRPVLTDEAEERIRDFYIDLRKVGESQDSVPITARQLETIIRLSEASAKGRLSDKVEIEDAERAIRLQKTCMQEVGVDPETGKFDIDIIATGSSKSKMNRMKTVIRIIKDLNKEYDEAGYEAIKDEAKEKGIEKEELGDILKDLKKNGDVYTPAYGVYKPTEE